MLDAFKKLINKLNANQDLAIVNLPDEALFRKLGSLEDLPKGQLAGKIGTVIDLMTTVTVLKSFKSESLEKLRKTFGSQVLTKAVLDLLVGMVDASKFKLLM